MFFSIIIPTYNRAHLISDTLDSIKSQNFRDYEVIIIDDGSIDKTRDVVEEYINCNSLQNWFYYFKPNGERGAARNYGVQKSRGEFLTFLDSDDLFYENHLHTAHQYIINHPTYELFHSAYEFKNKQTDKIRKIRYPDSKMLNHAVLEGNLVSCFGVFLKKEIAKQNQFEEDRSLSGSEDWLLWLHLSAKYPFYLQPVVTGCMVQHEERSVMSFNSHQLQKRADLLYHKLLDNVDFKSAFGAKKIRSMYAHMLTYGALHLVLSGKKRKGISMFLRAMYIDVRELFKARTLGIVKNLLKSYKS